VCQLFQFSNFSLLGIPCAAHQLQLGIKAALKEQNNAYSKSFQFVIKKAHNAVVELKRKNYAMEL